MRVRVYRNLHKNCWSIQSKTKKGWRLLRHATAVALADARYIVSQKGRERVLREQKKYVHAYVEGELLTDIHAWKDDYERDGHYVATVANLPPPNRPVLYNPYINTQFSYRDGTPAEEGRMVLLTRNMMVWEREQEVKGETA